MRIFHNGMRNVAAAITLLLLLYGCSVGMALSGKRQPNLMVVRVGAARGEIELHMGRPANSARLADGRSVDLYEYELGAEPSAGRAVLHGAMDFMTFGLWEIVGTPIEAYHGEKHELTITYSAADRVETISDRRVNGGTAPGVNDGRRKDDERR